MDNIILDNNNLLSLDRGTPKRRDMLPRIIRFFCWFFMVIAILCTIGLLASLVLQGTELRSGTTIFRIGYTLESYITLAIVLLKGFVGWALWTEKRWAVRLAKADAVI